MPRRRRQGTIRNLILIASGLISGAVVAIGLTVWGFRTDAMDDAVNDANNIATLLAEQTARSVQSIDFALTELRDRFTPLPFEGVQELDRRLGGRDSHELLKERAARLPYAAVMTVIGRDGRLVSSSRNWPVESIDASDRDFFRFLKATPESGIYVSAPVASRGTGAQTIFFAKRLAGADGFAGVVVVGVELTYFHHVYDSVRSLRGKTFLLLRQDGTILVRYPDAVDRTGHMIPLGSPWHQTVARGGGSYRSPGWFDGIKRLVAVRPMPGYPLVVDVAIAEDTALATWERRALLIGIGTLLAVCCSIWLVRRLAQQLRLLIDSESSLADRETKIAQKSRELEQVNGRLDSAVNNMSQGLLLFDAAERIVVTNRRYIDMYGLSPDVVKAGCSFRDLIAHRKATGTFSGDIEGYRASLMRDLATGEPSELIVETADGRSIRIVNQPLPDGGWVATHEDVTERQRLVAEQRRLEQQRERDREFLDTIINTTPMPIIVKELDNGQYILVNQAAVDYIGVPRERLVGKTTHEVWPKDAADVIVARDRDLSRSDGQLCVEEEHALDSPGKGLRVVTSKRTVILDGKGQPQYLLTVIEDITERKHSEAQIVHMAHHDLLTALPNRAFLMQKMEEAGARLRRWGEPFTVLILDLDRFKIVNDSLGHPAGDALLKQTASRLRSALRETDVLARLGGDEFAIIQIGEPNQPQAAAALAERIVEIIRSPYVIEGNEMTIGTSIGIAMAPEDGGEPNELIKKADLALYRTKSQGRNAYRFFDAQMTQEVDARHQLENDLRGAIAREELDLFYQPIIDIKSGKVFGAEALARWRHPQRGLVPPDQFIPLAEETGLIAPIGEWVLQRACADAARWPGETRVAVNLSALQFRRSNLFDVILCALIESGLSPQRLELEITESILLESDADPLTVIRRLKNIGVSIALDDFGTGYSSLSYLTKFPFDKIKIDKSFTQNLTKRAECAAIISSVRALGVGLNMLTVAEGVETEQQLGVLRAAGVDLAQGYLFGRPCPVSELRFIRDEPGQPAEHAA
jgi:diguanylate cyclase (GGDEF)-like protein/PAS domain S-box-containing protein